MTKEELIKLAEVANKKLMKECEYNSEAGDDLICDVDTDVAFKYWQPDKDITQAFEVLDTFDDYELTKYKDEGGHHCDLRIFDEEGDLLAIAQDRLIEKCICEAVLKALECKK